MADTDPRYPRSSIEDDFNYGSCVASASVHIRMAFLRKVYSILSLQVLLTTVTSALFLYFETLRTFVHDSPALIVVFALGSLGLIFALTLHRHTHPLNLYLLFAFVSTLMLSVPLAFSLGFQPRVVCTCACLCISMWGSEAGPGCLPLSLSTLILRQGLSRSECTISARLLSGEPQESDAGLCPPALGEQTSLTTPGFLPGLRGSELTSSC
uniref:Transmembrane BAX inhibitor motif containing 4 n=1 Tax=Rattus norvegicus TaxID=10116 RepID=A0ABK0LF25_RAT